MTPFSLVRLPELAAAQTHVAADPERRMYRAGGIDLLDRMKEGIDRPSQLVELSALAAGPHGATLRALGARDAGVFALGALVTLAEIEESAALPAGFRALREASASAATPGIRNAATLGGNLLQRPRCWYYRNAELSCLKKGGPTCLAETGRNRYHAVLGGGPSHIVHPSTLATALTALDATVVLADGMAPGTARSIALADLFQPPTVDPMREHTLAAGDLVLAIELPTPAADLRSAYEAAKEKQSHDWPLVEVAVRLAIRKGVMTDVRIALGHVAPIPWRSREAEQALEGQKPEAAVFERAATAALAPARPLSDNGYKIPLARGLLRSALHRVTEIPLPE